VEKKK
jgi:uncharacterized protein (DUF433 family)/predicted nuclease of predicted toxin-antitoxin system